jgi:hypothetical protein
MEIASEKRGCSPRARNASSTLGTCAAPGGKCLGELVSPQTAGKSVKTPDAKMAWRRTMALYGPAAESDNVI